MTLKLLPLALRKVLFSDDPDAPTTWTNDVATVTYSWSRDRWTWITPDGTDESDMYEHVLEAIKPYLTTKEN